MPRTGRVPLGSIRFGDPLFGRVHRQTGRKDVDMNDSSVRNRRKALLEWGVAARRDFPWRSTRDPWAVLVSEVMLQQTQVKRVVDRWPRFVERWPTPAACAATDLAELLAFWRGLGFPRRVRNLHRTARLIVDKHRGEVPRTVDELLLLPLSLIHI